MWQRSSIFFLQKSVVHIPSLTLKMAALCSTEYITDLSEGRSKQPNQRVARPPASYFGDPGFKLRWAHPELSLFFLDPSSHIPKYYLKSSYDRFFSYPCQLFNHKSYYYSLRTELPRCPSIPGEGRKFFSHVKYLGRQRDSVSVLCCECYRVLPREKSNIGVRQTVHLHLMSSLRMSGAISTLPPVPSSRAHG